MARQTTILWTLLGVVSGLAVGAWYAGSRIQSPAELAARTAPPEPSPILAPVEKRVLSSEIITRGTVRFGLPRPISIVPSTAKAGTGLIGMLPRPNTTFREGEVMLAVSGRPVFVLQGDIPTFRDMAPATKGDDVKELEAALERLGFDPGPVDGLYDLKTSAAVERMYRAAGREAFGPTREQKAALFVLERDMLDAKRAKVAAGAALETAERSVAAAQALAEQNIRKAELDSAVQAGAQSRMRKRSGTPSAVEVERARAAQAVYAAEADVAARTSDYALIALDPRQTRTAIATVEAQLKAARAARHKAKVEAALAIRNAARESELAGKRIGVAEATVESARLEGDRGISQAMEQRKVAEFDLKVASERAARLESEYNAMAERLGIQLPADEVVFVPTLPVRVHEVSAVVGASASGAVMSVTDNKLTIDSKLTIETAPLVKPGMKVSVEEQAFGFKATGTVETVANSPGTNGVDGYHFYMAVGLDEVPSRNLAGISARLAIPTVTTDGAVLVVPTSALWLSADGKTRVQVVRGKTMEQVEVAPGLSAGGFVEVTPIDGKLEAGDRVVVGSKSAEAS